MVRSRLLWDQDDFIARLIVLEVFVVSLHKPDEIPTVPQCKRRFPIGVPTGVGEIVQYLMGPTYLVADIEIQPVATYLNVLIKPNGMTRRQTQKTNQNSYALRVLLCPGGHA